MEKNHALEAVDITVRKSGERGHFDHGWLETYHTFSFGDYYDPRHHGFSDLRVINEDYVRPGEGFPTHSHRDMEIVTYILEGALEHKDSMGNTSVIRPGEVQRMSAGSGVTHSEYNPSKTEKVHLLQIWLYPEARGLKPEYEQKSFDRTAHKNGLRLVVSPDGAEGSVKIHQNARMFDALLEKDGEIKYRLNAGRSAWLQLIKGSLGVNGGTLAAGDGAALTGKGEVLFRAREEAEFLLFDLSAVS